MRSKKKPETVQKEEPNSLAMSAEKELDAFSRFFLESLEQWFLTPECQLWREIRTWWGSFSYKNRQARESISVRDFLHEPRFNTGHIQRLFPGVTYRQINHWESKNLIEPSRETDETGWRRFSLVDIATLAIITQLRAYGASLTAIKGDLWHLTNQESMRCEPMQVFLEAILDGDSPRPLEVQDQLTDLELYLCFCTIVPISAVCSPGFRLIIAPSDAILVYLARLMQEGRTFLQIPISEYLRRAVRLVDGDPGEYNPGLLGMITGGYKDILTMIQAADTEAVKITKKSGGKLDVRRLRRKSGRFDDQEIMKVLASGDHLKTEIVKKDGKVVTITIEDRLQIRQ